MHATLFDVPGAENANERLPSQIASSDAEFMVILNTRSLQTTRNMLRGENANDLQMSFVRI